MHPISRRNFIGTTSGAALAGTVGGHAPFAAAQEGESLSELAMAKGVYFGTAIDDRSLSDDRFAEIAKRECSMLVAENGMKWRSIRPEPARFDFTSGDRIANFCEANGMKLRGHTLVWHRSLPEWFEQSVTRANATEFLLEHIEKVAGHYAGRVHSWDVVNEATDPAGNRSDQMRATPFMNFIGEDYIRLAFEAAAAADPNALLTYNDFYLPYDWRDEHERKRMIPRLLEDHLSKGVPIHAFGLQGHLWAGRNDFDERSMRNLLREVADLGLEIMVTELDVRDQKLPSPDRVRDVFVADSYRRFLDVALDEPATKAVLTWGLSDRYTWLASSFPRSDGLPVRVLPYDNEMQRKPLVWNAFADAFKGAPSR